MSASLTQLVDWLARIRGWLRHGRMVWAALLAIPAPPLLLFLGWWYVVPSWEDRVRLTGMCLELAGLVLVVAKLAALRTEFEVDGPLVALRKYLKLFPRWHVERRTGSYAELLGGREAFSGTGQVTPATSPDDRLNILEPRVYALENRVRGVEGAVEQKFESERVARKAGEEASYKKLKAATAGTLYLDAIGAWFLMLGVVLATASKEIVGLLTGS